MRYPCLVMITGCKEIWITLFCCLVYIDPLLNIYLSLARFVTMLRILIVWKEVHIDNIYLSSLPRCLNEKKKKHCVYVYKGAASETPPTENGRVQRLCHLALRIGTHLQWNLEILEEK